jgi:hypothetical protein
MEKPMNIACDFDGDDRFYSVFLPQRKDYYKSNDKNSKRRKKLIARLLKERKDRSILNKISDRQMIRWSAKLKKFRKKMIARLPGRKNN